MKKIFYNLFLLPVLALCMTACGDDYYTDDFLKNSSDKLCGYVWEEVYDSQLEGVDMTCVHRIKFNKKDGNESMTYYKEGQSIPVSKTEYAFYWEWCKDMETIQLKYGTGNDEFFENVWVRETYLSGKLHNKTVTFKKVK